MKRSVIIIGAGPAGLMAAATLDTSRYDVVVCERNAAPGRKFLVAGDGGLNITHSEIPERFIERYTPPDFFRKMFMSFSNADLIRWLAGIGVPAFTGSSGRVFPQKHLKPIDVLNAILESVRKNRVRFLLRHEWKGFSENGHLAFDNEGTSVELRADIRIFALGGGSWPVTGSKGEWLSYFSECGIAAKPFAPSNCAMLVKWSDDFLEQAEGKPLKNIVIRCGEKAVKGEVVITAAGLEGSGIYPLSPAIRKELARAGECLSHFDLLPEMKPEQVTARLRSNTKKSVGERLKAIGLHATKRALVKACTSRQVYGDVSMLAPALKALPVTVCGMGPVEDAISTVGGISLDEVDDHLGLKKMPSNYVIGEMLDYDAPTGGYLLQSCFTMGHFVASHLNES